MQIWLLDTRSPDFVAECGRQSVLIRQSERAHEADDEAWFAMSDKTGWTQ